MSVAFAARCAHLPKGDARSVACVFLDGRGRSPSVVLRGLSCARTAIAAQTGSVCVSAMLNQRCGHAVGHRTAVSISGAIPPLGSFTAPQQSTAEDLFTSRFGTNTAGHRRGTAADAAPPLASPNEGVNALFTARFPAMASQATAERIPRATAPPGATRTQARPWGGLWRCLTSYSHLPAVRISGNMDNVLHPASGINAMPAPAPPPAGFFPQHPPVANADLGPSPSGHQPPPPEVQRYWHSYRLWATLHPHIQQDQQAVLQLRAQAHIAKVAQQESLRQHLYRTMYWTLFVVCPLLSLLFLWLAIDAAAYGAELELLPFVKYDEALRDFAEAEGHHRHLRHGKGHNGATRKKKTIRID